jgi:hypothetical protein
MDIQFINENKFISVEENESTIGRTIQFPNNDGELHLGLYGESDEPNEEALDNLEEIANQIAEDYDAFKEALAQFVADNLEDEQNISPSDILSSIDLISMIGHEEAPLIVFITVLDGLLDEGQLLKIYYDMEEDQFVDLEIDECDESEDENEL